MSECASDLCFNGCNKVSCVNAGLASLLLPLFPAFPPIINVLRIHSGALRTRTWLPLKLLSSSLLLLPSSGYQLPAILGAYCG